MQTNGQTATQSACVCVLCMPTKDLGCNLKGPFTSVEEHLGTFYPWTVDMFLVRYVAVNISDTSAVHG